MMATGQIGPWTTRTVDHLARKIDISARGQFGPLDSLARIKDTSDRGQFSLLNKTTKQKSFTDLSIRKN
jgi:hypothetical protein